MQLHYRSGSQERDLGMAGRRRTIPGPGRSGTWSKQVGARGRRAQEKIVP